MKQNNQTSWAARLRKISALCLALMVSASVWATGTLTVKPAVKAGQKDGKITIALDNAKDFTAFQMDLTLPEGLSITSMEIDSQVDFNHHVAYNPVGGVIKVAAYSFDGASSGNEAFKANGDFLIINVEAADDYAGGDVVIDEESIIFVTYGDLEAVTDFTIVNEQGEEILLGDVNDDGKINTQDILLIVDKILGVDNPSFNADAADLNRDGKINTQDILLVVDIILTTNLFDDYEKAYIKFAFPWCRCWYGLGPDADCW